MTLLIDNSGSRTCPYRVTSAECPQTRPCKVSFYAKGLLNLAKPYLVHLKPTSLSFLHFSYQVSLAKYFGTRGLLNSVAGEGHEQVCFGACCMTMVEVG